MQSLDIKAFAGLPELATAYRESDILPRVVSSRMPPDALEMALAAPALVAAWIAQFAPTLTGKEPLRIAIVSTRPGGLEALHRGHWYSVLSQMMGLPADQVKVSIV